MIRGTERSSPYRLSARSAGRGRRRGSCSKVVQYGISSSQAHSVPFIVTSKAPGCPRFAREIGRLSPLYSRGQRTRWRTSVSTRLHGSLVPSRRQVQRLTEPVTGERALPSGPPWPSEGPDRDLGGCGKQFLDLRVKTAERDGRAGHIKRSAVVADVVPPDVDPALRQLFVRVPVQQVQ